MPGAVPRGSYLPGIIKILLQFLNVSIGGKAGGMLALWVWARLVGVDHTALRLTAASRSGGRYDSGTALCFLWGGEAWDGVRMQGRLRDKGGWGGPGGDS